MGKRKRCGNCGVIGHNIRTCEAKSTAKVSCTYCSNSFSPVRGGFLRHINQCPAKSAIITKKMLAVHKRLKTVDIVLTVTACFAFGYALGRVSEGFLDQGIAFSNLSADVLIYPNIEKIVMAILAGGPKAVSMWMMRRSVGEIEEVLAMQADVSAASG